MIAAAEITGLVLAGGQGRRMGGVDKGLMDWRGKPLAAHALDRLRPQVAACALSANRHLDRYAALGVPVWPDAQADYPGPLAGVLAGLTRCTTPWLLTVPCDAPDFPADLARRLSETLAAPGAEGLASRLDGEPGRAQPRMAMAWARCGDGAAGEGLRPQPVFCLIHRSLREALADFLARGNRRAMDWAAQAGALRVDFDRPGLDAGAFRNLNTPADWAAGPDRA